MADSCPHLSLVLKVDKEELLQKSEGCCSDCQKKGKLWSCLQHGCQYIGCGEKDMDHSTKHYKESKHSIAVNLVSFRIWCYACNVEVHLHSAFTPSEMKCLKRQRRRRMNDSKFNQQPPPQPENSRTDDEILKTNKKDPMTFSAGMETDDREVTDDEIPLGLTGLRNLGNTCYMNSALQAISNCLPLTSHFLNDEMSLGDKKPSMAKNYTKLIKDIWNPLRHPCIAPTGVHMTLKSINPAFRGYHQQDAQEFLRCLMDRLHEELKYPVPNANWEEHQRHNMDHSSSSQHNNIEPMEIDVEDTSPDHPSMNFDQRNVNNHGKSSSTESFHSTTSEPDLTNSGSQSGIPGVSAGAINRMDTSYDNLSQLHGQEKSQANSFDTHKVVSWPQLNKPQFKRPHSPVTLNKEASKVKKPKKSMYHFRSVISAIFDGELRSSVQCLTCDQVSHTRETFQDLSLPIPGKDDLVRLHGTSGYYPASGSTILPVVPGFKGRCTEARTSYVLNSVWGAWEWIKSWVWGPQVTLRDCLSAFFSADELKGDNMYSCEKCRKLRNGVKYCRLLQLPEVLCIHLKRFRHEYLMSYSSKISSPVSFPITGLDLRHFLAQDSPSNCTKYDLCSVIVHLGNAGGGHYTTFAKNFTNHKWYEFDDQFVTQVPESTVANAEAYVLFYCKSNVEAGRARERMMNLWQEQHKLSLVRNPSTRSLLHFYVSMRWANKFMTFVEPGPIDNSDFVCRHLDIMPEIFHDLERVTIQVTEVVWQVMHSRFGGGPSVTQARPCQICEDEYRLLQERRHYERETFVELNRSSREVESSECVYISLEWFREWEDFLHEKLPEAPGEVDNHPICFTKEGKHFLKKNSPHAPISVKAWEFLTSIYGGGPVVSVRYRHTSTSPPRNTKPRTVPPSPTEAKSPEQSFAKDSMASPAEVTSSPEILPSSEVTSPPPEKELEARGVAAKQAADNVD